MSKDWISTSQVDPRMPTDPEYVSVDALANNYSVSRDALIQIAIRYPRIAQTSGGNPWTENTGETDLFLHEPSVANHLKVAENPSS